MVNWTLCFAEILRNSSTMKCLLRLRTSLCFRLRREWKPGLTQSSKMPAVSLSTINNLNEGAKYQILSCSSFDSVLYTKSKICIGYLCQWTVRPQAVLFPCTIAYTHSVVLVVPYGVIELSVHQEWWEKPYILSILWEKLYILSMMGLLVDQYLWMHAMLSTGWFFAYFARPILHPAHACKRFIWRSGYHHSIRINM